MFCVCETTFQVPHHLISFFSVHSIFNIWSEKQIQSVLELMVMHLLVFIICTVALLGLTCITYSTPRRYVAGL